MIVETWSCAQEQELSRALEDLQSRLDSQASELSEARASKEDLQAVKEELEAELSQTRRDLESSKAEHASMTSRVEVQLPTVLLSTIHGILEDQNICHWSSSMTTEVQPWAES